MNNLLRLPSEQEVTSEQIVSCEYTETVNSGTDLTLGSVCSASLKFTVRTEETLFHEGMPLEYYVVEGDVRTLIGVFVCQKPSYQQRNLVEVEAYDMISRTETDLSAWLRENQSLFPMPLLDFAAAVCEQCGLTLANESIPNGDYSVPAFYSDGLTGRQLLQWVGEICARFVRATPDGQVEFAWYNDRRDGLQEAGQSIGPSKSYKTVYLFDSNGAQLADSEGALLVTDEVRGHAYFEGSLSYEEYTTAPIQKVQIKQAEDDVGVVWPDVTGNRNTYVISGNLLLATESEDAIKGIAESIYKALLNIQYRPCTVSITSTTEIRAGDIVEVQDANGGGFITFIFSRTSTGGRDTLESTGSASRNSNTAVNQQKYTNLQGKVLQLQTSVDGLRVVNKDLTGKYAELSLTVDGIEAQVYNEDGSSKIEQTADAIRLKVDKNDVRNSFAGESSSIDITQGQIKFSSNTLVVESSNFKLTAEGNVSATGSFKSTNSDGSWVSELNSGGLSISSRSKTYAHLFRAGNYDAAYLVLNGRYGATDQSAWYSPDGITIHQNGNAVFQVDGSGNVKVRGITAQYMNGQELALIPISVGSVTYLVYGPAGQGGDFDALGQAQFASTGTSGYITQSSSSLVIFADGSDMYRGAYVPVEIGNYRTLTVTYSLSGNYNLSSIGLSPNINFAKDPSEMGYVTYRNAADIASGTWTVDVSGYSGLMYLKAIVWHASPSANGSLTITKAIFTA